MKNIMIFIVAVLMLGSCNAQIDKEQDELTKNKIEPKVDYKVNKEFDENGNLIAYDSIYTYYYSNIDKNAMLKDSIFKKFNEHFNLEDPFLGNTYFNDFFKQENYLKEDFFTEDFFRENFKHNQEMMNQILSRMDSLKNHFLLKKYPIEVE